jgi:hypothetical protein
MYHFKEMCVITTYYCKNCSLFIERIFNTICDLYGQLTGPPGHIRKHLSLNTLCFECINIEKTQKLFESIKL